MPIIDASVPADTEAVRLGAQRIRETRQKIDDILGVYLNDDGTFKNDVVPGAALADASVVLAKLASDVFPVLRTPSGAIMAYAGSSAPTNWLLCNGQAVSRPIANGGTVDTYATLWAVIGITFGNGDGSTTFNVPDLRGRVPVGLDGGQSRSPSIAALGDTHGEHEHTLAVTEIPAHHHGASGSGNSFVCAGGGSTAGAGSTTNWEFRANTADTGGGLAHENMQPSLGINYIIRI